MTNDLQPLQTDILQFHQAERHRVIEVSMNRFGNELHRRVSGPGDSCCRLNLTASTMRRSAATMPYSVDRDYVVAMSDLSFRFSRRKVGLKLQCLNQSILLAAS